MTKRRAGDCVLQICDGTGWIDVTDWADPGQTRCPCGQATEPPPDLHDRIMGAVRAELRTRRPVDDLHDSYNRRWDFLNGGWL